MTGLARPPRSLRGRIPKWVEHLGKSGVPEATAGFLAFLYNEAFSSSDRAALEFVQDFALCFFAGVSGRWPRVGTYGVGVVLLFLLLVPNRGPLPLPPAVFALFIPIVSNGAHGRTMLRDIAAVVYALLGIITTVQIDTSLVLQAQSVIIWAVAVGLAWGVGRTIHRLREEGEKQVKLRAEALRGQRRSIARDLHDTVSYATTTMIMRAEQIKLRTSGDPQLVEDLDFIISTGRRSVRDLRGMMETLRRNDPDLDLEADAPWRLLTVSDVIRERQAELAAHGLALHVSTDLDLDALPVSVRETLGKLVVEATANMVKYAGKGPCQIIIEQHGNTLEAVFTNRLRPRSSHSETGTGLGIIGASERVRALGGELEATVASGTWILRAQLPLEG